MATRRSLVSRGFTSVAAGPSSTNRFLKPPRAVGEYTTVAEDLRSTKNAVGPAAQPLRPRARVDTGGGGDGGNIDTSYEIGSRARASVRGSEASLETSKTSPNVDSFGAIPATISASKSRATAIGIGGTVVDVLTGGLSKPFTTVMSGVATYDAYKTSKELSDTLYGTPADTVQRSINKGLESLKSFNVNEDIVNPIVDTLTSIPSMVGLGATTAPVKSLTAPATSYNANPLSGQKPSRATREERQEQTIINKNTRDIAESLRSAKQKAQVDAITSRNAANASITIGNYGSSGSDESGGFDSGVDDSGQATGQDQYD